VITDEEGHEEALAVYINWGISEIMRYIQQVFAGHESKKVLVKRIRENVYSWKVKRNPDTPAPIDFEITPG
jgi:hypothetical protein